jgi:hypothetical protein
VLRIVSVFLMKMIKIIILYDELGPEIKRSFEIECRGKIAIQDSEWSILRHLSLAHDEVLWKYLS